MTKERCGYGFRLQKYFIRPVHYSFIRNTTDCYCTEDVTPANGTLVCWWFRVERLLARESLFGLSWTAENKVRCLSLSILHWLTRTALDE